MPVKKKVAPVKQVKAESLQFTRFAAIDFETADYGRDSACALGVVIAENGMVVETRYSLLRPPRKDFIFSWLHGITWRDVANKPTFGEYWTEMEELFNGVDFIAAHNAGFDRGVLRACCALESLGAPKNRFLCTMKLARRLWSVYPTKLSDVCDHFNIPLRHHDAASDALACANIVLKAEGSVVPVSALLAG